MKWKLLIIGIMLAIIAVLSFTKEGSDVRQDAAEKPAVRQDEGEAVRRYRLAAEQGDTDAQTSLRSLYAEGRGVQQDAVEKPGVGEEDEAVRWVRLAAEQGYAPAQTKYGNMHAEGRGVPEDDDKAVHWV